MLTGLDAFLDRGGAFVKLLVRLAERGAGNRTGRLRFHGEGAGVVRAAAVMEANSVSWRSCARKNGAAQRFGVASRAA